MYPIDMNTMRFFDRVVLDDGFAGMALSDGEGDRVAGLMRDGKSVVLMANHGVLVTGSSVAAAFDELYYFERAAQTLLTCYGTGQAAAHAAGPRRGPDRAAMARLRPARARPLRQHQGDPGRGGPSYRR